MVTPGRSDASTFRTATSVLGSLPTTLASSSLAVRERHFHRVRVLDEVIIGEDIAVGAHDHAGANAALSGRFESRLRSGVVIEESFVEEPTEERMIPAWKPGRGGCDTRLGGGIDLDDAGGDALDNLGVTVLPGIRQGPVVDVQFDGCGGGFAAGEGLVDSPGTAGAEGGNAKDQRNPISESRTLIVVHGNEGVGFRFAAIHSLSFAFTDRRHHEDDRKLSCGLQVCNGSAGRLRLPPGRTAMRVTRKPIPSGAGGGETICQPESGRPKLAPWFVFGKTRRRHSVRGTTPANAHASDSPVRGVFYWQTPGNDRVLWKQKTAERDGKAWINGHR
jgi:hypothetical protein